MTKVLISCALIFAGSQAVHADNIRLATGKYLTGRVYEFTNSNFQVEFENHSTTNLPAKMVQTIDFDNETVQSSIELTTQSGTKGKISLYDKGFLSVENDDGMVNRVPLQQLVSVTFGDPPPAPTETAKKDLPPKDPAKKAIVPDHPVTKVEQVTDSDLSKHIVRGRVTIVDFYADWCGPCRSIGPHLEELTQKNDAVILRRVNIDQNRALAAKFGIEAIPHIIVYDKSGRDIGTIQGANPGGVDQLIAKATAGN